MTLCKNTKALWDVDDKFSNSDKVKIHTTQKVAQQRLKSHCGFDKASEVFNKFLTTVSLSLNGLQANYTRQVSCGPGLF